MARDTAGKGELGEELFKAERIAADVRIDLAVSAFEVGVGHDGGAAVAGA